MARAPDVVDPTGAGDALAAGFLVSGIELGLERPPVVSRKQGDAVTSASSGTHPTFRRHSPRCGRSSPWRRSWRTASPGEGLAVGRECEQRIRDGGAVPATVAVMDGALHVGLDDEQLERVAAAGSDARKVSPRDLAACIVDGTVGATTVGATLAACCLAAISVAATGGIGGVHRGYATRPDVSADLAELARTPTSSSARA